MALRHWDRRRDVVLLRATLFDDGSSSINAVLVLTSPVLLLFPAPLIEERCTGSNRIFTAVVARELLFVVVIVGVVMEGEREKSEPSDSSPDGRDLDTVNALLTVTDPSSPATVSVSVFTSSFRDGNDDSSFGARRIDKPILERVVSGGID